MSLTHKWDDSLAQKVREEEEKVDKYEDALGTYLVKLSSREMSHADSQSVNTLLHTISDFERISDHSVNILSSAEEIHAKSIEFSKDAQEELQVLEGCLLYTSPPSARCWPLSASFCTWAKAKSARVLAPF